MALVCLLEYTHTFVALLFMRCLLVLKGNITFVYSSFVCNRCQGDGSQAACRDFLYLTMEYLCLKVKTDRVSRLV